MQITIAILIAHERATLISCILLFFFFLFLLFFFFFHYCPPPTSSRTTLQRLCLQTCLGRHPTRTLYSRVGLNPSSPQVWENFFFLFSHSLSLAFTFISLYLFVLSHLCGDRKQGNVKRHRSLSSKRGDGS